MKALDELTSRVRELQRALIQRAEQHTHTVMAGYTHLQPAQPVSVAHWLMSTFWMLERDLERIQQARVRCATSPLGSGALAGTPLSINREELAWALGFKAISENSLDGVSDRDFVADGLYVIALMGIHLSRLAEDIIIFSNPNFGYVTLDDRYSTGSSLMPQKRNADPMELTRGKAGRLIGNLTGLLATLKGLPTGYNKDLQEDKETLFDSVDTMMQLLPVITGVVLTLKFNEERMKAALGEEMLATDLADYLVAKGLPFRQAHHVVGRVVRWSVQNHATLSEVPLEAMQEFSDLFDEDVARVFDFEQSMSKRRARGGTAPNAVLDQISLAKIVVSK
jgi:argininosuccinate lyase